jgi:hypothetical protein
MIASSINEFLCLKIEDFKEFRGQDGIKCDINIFEK